MYKKISFVDIIPDLISWFPQSDLSIIRVILPRPQVLYMDIKTFYEINKEGKLVLDADGKIDLSPSIISRFAKENNWNLKWENIPDWDAIEAGFEISNKDMLNIIYKEKSIPKGSVILISAESAYDFEGFQIHSEDLLSFINDVYDESDYDYEFFGGRQNLIFIWTEQKTITLFSHRGVFVHINCLPGNK